jgi:hypothetical protein
LHPSKVLASGPDNRPAVPPGLGDFIVPQIGRTARATNCNYPKGCILTVQPCS